MDANARTAGESDFIGQLAGWQVKRVVRFIDENLTEPILLKDMSAVAQRSTAYFCRAFKRTFGRSPHAYLIGRRVKLAGDLMLESDAPPQRNRPGRRLRRPVPLLPPFPSGDRPDPCCLAAGADGRRVGRLTDRQQIEISCRRPSGYAFLSFRTAP